MKSRVRARWAARLDCHARRGTTLAAAVAWAACSLAACTPANDDPAALTADEDRQLNGAAARLDAAANAVPAEAAPAGPDNESSVP